MNEKYIFIHGIEKNFVSRGVKAGGIKRGIPQIGNVKKKKGRGKEKRASAREITFSVVFMRSGTRMGGRRILIYLQNVSLFRDFSFVAVRSFIVVCCPVSWARYTYASK